MPASELDRCFGTHKMKPFPDVPVLFAALAFSALSGCTSYAGRNLAVGVAKQEEVQAVMGSPAMQWTEQDGSVQLAYPRGPAGTQTFMIFLAPGGRLQRIVNVLEEKTFSRVKPRRDSQAEVLKLLGPPAERQTVYYTGRNVLVWEWLYCDAFSTQAWFGVEFEGMAGAVVSTYSRPDYRGWDGIVPVCGRYVQKD